MFPRNPYEHDNADGTEPPDDERTCEHGKLMTEACDECEQDEAERATERQYEAFHGGSSPFNDAERESVRQQTPRSRRDW
jgi:hypothetical protein